MLLFASLMRFRIKLSVKLLIDLDQSHISSVCQSLKLTVFPFSVAKWFKTNMQSKYPFILIFYLINWEEKFLRKKLLILFVGLRLLATIILSLKLAYLVTCKKVSTFVSDKWKWIFTLKWKMHVAVAFICCCIYFY